MSPSLPTVVITGRPNVGKSTLFNLITSSRRAIVGNEPGITRDRIHAQAGHSGRSFEIIDTGGIVAGDAELIPTEILKQARVAFDQASHIIFLVDGRSELTAADRDLARMLHRLGKPVSVAVNKIDAASREQLAAAFHELGFEHVFPVSAEHRLGVDDLLDHVTADFSLGGAAPTAVPEIKVAIIGRPNSGKSTLLNSLVGEERSIVTPVAGTTRDAVDASVIHEGVRYVFVDTAGIRRKGKTRLMAEKLSVVMAKRHIRMANVVLVLIDGVEGLVAVDAAIAGYAHEQGRPVVLCVNKWDAVLDRDKPAWVRRIRDELKYLDYAPVAFFSAKSGAGVRQVFGLIRRGFDSANRRVTTGELNRIIEPLAGDLNTRIRYITQAGVRPPLFVVFADGGPLHFSKERFLANRIREHFGFAGSPVVIKSRVKSKPASGR